MRRIVNYGKESNILPPQNSFIRSQKTKIFYYGSVKVVIKLRVKNIEKKIKI